VEANTQEVMVITSVPCLSRQARSSLRALGANLAEMKYHCIGDVSNVSRRPITDFFKGGLGPAPSK